VVRPAGREHVFDHYIQQQGVQRNVVVELSHFMSLLPVLESSDLIATVPEDLATLLTRYGALRYITAPLDSPVIDVHLFWHERCHHDEAHQWLRRLIFKLLGGV
jgi:DNA-binding transcriptional LysR family regulator